MNLKTPFTYLAIIFIAIQLASCATASPTPEIITPTPLSTLTPTATPIPSETSTPKPTETATASPTPEVQLHGLVENMEDFPVYSAEEANAAYESAKASVLTDVFSTDKIFTRFNPFALTGPVYDAGVRISCHSTIDCIVDSYRTVVDGEQIYTITYRMHGTVDDGTDSGTQGTIVVPIVINGGDGDQSVFTALGQLVYAGSRTTNAMYFLTILDPRSPKPELPVMQTLRNQITSNARVVELLAQIDALAAQGFLPSQELIDELLELNPQAFIME